MKKTYEELEMEVIRFSTEDIITTSETATNNNEQTTTQDQTPTNVLAPTQDQTPAQGQEDSGIIVDNGHTYYPTDQTDSNGNKLYYQDGEDPNNPAWIQLDGKWVAYG